MMISIFRYYDAQILHSRHNQQYGQVVFPYLHYSTHSLIYQSSHSDYLKSNKKSERTLVICPHRVYIREQLQSIENRNNMASISACFRSKCSKIKHTPKSAFAILCFSAIKIRARASTSCPFVSGLCSAIFQFGNRLERSL